MTKDLTQGSPVRLILGFALPLLAGMLFQQLYNLVDTLIVGRFLGMEALAGVGATGSINFLVLGFCMGVCSGFAIPVAQQFGAREESRMREFVANGTWLSIVFALVMTVLTVVYCGDILRVMNTPTDCFEQAYDYIVVIFAGIPFTFLYNLLSGWLRSLGDSKTPLFFLVLSSVLNVILDLAFILIFKLGVFGASLATVLSQAVGACWILKFLTGPKTILKLRKEYLRVERGVILPVLGLGISSFVMLSTESLLSISFSSSLARYGGDIAVGAMTVITSVSQLCTLPIQGICQGGQPVMSFNFGAGKKARVKEAFRFQLTLCFGYTTLFWLLMMAVPGVVAGIFTSDAALIDYTTWAMRIYMAGILAMGVQIACQQSFMALGQAKVSLLLACLRKIILLIPLIFILPHFVADRCFGVFLAEPVSDLLAATITAITFFSRFDKILDRGAGRA
jgi:putative MATE family efflux protein